MTIDHDALARRIARRLTTANGLITIDARCAVSVISEVLREAMPTSEAKCEWTQQGDQFGPDWATTCGNLFRLEDEWPSDNGMAYCCFCGKKLACIPIEEPEDYP